MDFVRFSLALIAPAYIIQWVFNNTGGSVLMTILTHATWNTFYSTASSRSSPPRRRGQLPEPHDRRMGAGVGDHRPDAGAARLPSEISPSTAGALKPGSGLPLNSYSVECVEGRNYEVRTQDRSRGSSWFILAERASSTNRVGGYPSPFLLASYLAANHGGSGEGGIRTLETA
jgi:hypothetical protein